MLSESHGHFPSFLVARANGGGSQVATHQQLKASQGLFPDLVHLQCTLETS